MGKKQKKTRVGVSGPPPEELGRANSKTCDVTQDLQKERGKSHIKVVKLDPPLSESDRSGFLIDDFDMAFAMFLCEHLQTKSKPLGDSLGGHFAGANEKNGTQWRITIRSAVSSMSLLWSPPKAFARRNNRIGPVAQVSKKGQR